MQLLTMQAQGATANPLQRQAPTAGRGQCVKASHRVHRRAHKPFSGQPLQQALQSSKAQRVAAFRAVHATATPASSKAQPAASSSGGDKEAYDVVIVGAGVSGLTTALVRSWGLAASDVVF